MISGTNKYNEIEMHHSIEVKDRAKMIITGVNDVSEFSDNAVKLKTNLGGLMIRGNNLSINKLNTPNGFTENLFIRFRRAYITSHLNCFV